MSFQSKNLCISQMVIELLNNSECFKLELRKLNIKKIFLHRKCIKNICWATTAYHNLTYNGKTLIHFGRLEKGILCEIHNDKPCSETLLMKIGKFMLRWHLRKNYRISNENINGFCSSLSCKLDWKSTFDFIPVWRIQILPLL